MVILILIANHDIYCEVINVRSKETLTFVELNKGDMMNFTLKNGRIVSFELVDCRVNLIFTTIDTLKKSGSNEATIYSMSCNGKIDGQ